jgi:hypothetical protein
MPRLPTGSRQGGAEASLKIIGKIKGFLDHARNDKETIAKIAFYLF